MIDASHDMFADLLTEATELRLGLPWTARRWRGKRPLFFMQA